MTGKGSRETSESFRSLRCLMLSMSRFKTGQYVNECVQKSIPYP
jgi:hypothetical protein